MMMALLVSTGKRRMRLESAITSQCLKRIAKGGRYILKGEMEIFKYFKSCIEPFTVHRSILTEPKRSFIKLFKQLDFSQISRTRKICCRHKVPSDNFISVRPFSSQIAIRN